MKRRVRIYKAGGQHGSYINKTAQYFQEGDMQMQEEVAPEEQPAQELSDEQVITFIMQTLSQPNGSIEQAKQQLVQANITPARITQLSEAALEYINQQQDIALAEATGNEEDAAAMKLEQDANDRAVAEEEQAAQQAAQNQEMYAQSEESAVDPNENDDSSAAYMRSGGMPNKRAYISNFIKLAKKQEGGDTEESKSDIKTDIPVGGRVEKVSKFHNALKSTANNVALKEQAEKQYEQQMQQMQQMPPQGYAQDGGDAESGISDFDPYHNLEHYSGAFEHSMPFNALTEAQFGGWGHGRERRAARRMNRMMPQGFNQMANIMGNMGNQMINPFMQQQMNPLAQFMPNQGNLGLANIDVRRTGIFGRPKEYTINFNTASPVTIKDVADTKKQEINNAETTKKEVEETVKEEETNTATTKNAEVEKTADELPEESDITVTTNEVKRNSGKNLSGGNENVNVIGNGTGIMPIPEQQPIQSKGVIQNAINKANQYPSIGTNQNITPITGAKVGPFDFTKIANVGQGMGNVLAQTVQDKAKAEKIAKWKEHLRQEKINALPFLEKQMWYAEHPEDKPKIKPGKKPISTSNNGVIKWQQGGFTDPNSGLYKFMGGGEDMNQANLDYSDSKNISTPYFSNGGLYRFQKEGEVTDENTCLPGMTGCFPQGSEGNKEVVELTEDEKAAKVIADKEAADKLVASKIASDKLAAETARNAYIDEQMKKGNNTNSNVDYENFNYAQQYLQNLGLGANNPFSFISRGNNWNKAIGKPYGTGTLNPISGMIGPNAQVSSINVDKTRMFGPNKGAPKKFTVNYNVPGQPGINASGTPQSYVGSDGQTHWMNSNTNNAGQLSNQSWRDKRNDRRTERTSKWFGEHGKDTWTGTPHDKNDEAYKEQFGHYPGEEKISTKFIPPTQDQLENETYEPIPGSTPETDPGYQLDAEGMRAIPQYESPYSKLQTRPLTQIENGYVPELMPGINMYNEPQNTLDQTEEMPPMVNTAGPMVGAEDMVQEYEPPFSEKVDLMNSQLQVPDYYPNSMGDRLTQEQVSQNLNENLHGVGYMPENELLNYDHYDSSNDFKLDPITNKPVIRQKINRRNTNPSNNNRVTNNNNNNNRAVNNKSDDAPIEKVNSNVSKTTLTPKQQKADQEYKRKQVEQEARSRAYIVPEGSNPIYNNSDEVISDVAKRQEQAQKSFRQAQEKFKKTYGIDQSTLEMYLNVENTDQARSMEKAYPQLKQAAIKYKPVYTRQAQEKAVQDIFNRATTMFQRQYGGNALPKAQFGPPEDIPFGYFKDPNGTGVYRNLAGEIYKPKTNLEGNTDKLMGNEFTQEGNGLTTDKSMGFDSSGTGYRNEGLLSDEEKQAGAMNKVSQKFKNKQEWNIDAKGALDFGNMAGNKLAGFLERSQQTKQNRNMGSKYDASNLYAQTDEKDRGTYGQEGDFKPNETGFKGVVKYGGYMEEGGSYKEGGYTWMSKEQIEQFLAEGGELEFV